MVVAIQVVRVPICAIVILWVKLDSFCGYCYLLLIFYLLNNCVEIIIARKNGESLP